MWYYVNHSIAVLSSNKQLRLFCFMATMWSILFMIVSIYWAFGGKLGLETLGESITTSASQPVFIWFVWLTAAMKLGAAIVAIALCYKWKHRQIRMISLMTGFFVGTLCLLYGLANVVVRALMALDLISTPEAMYSSAAFWHLVLWNPWWIAGGVLFLAASVTAYRRV